MSVSKPLLCWMTAGAFRCVLLDLSSRLIQWKDTEEQCESPNHRFTKTLTAWLARLKSVQEELTSEADAQQEHKQQLASVTAGCDVSRAMWGVCTRVCTEGNVSSEWQWEFLGCIRGCVRSERIQQSDGDVRVLVQFRPHSEECGGNSVLVLWFRNKTDSGTSEPQQNNAAHSSDRLPVRSCVLISPSSLCL